MDGIGAYLEATLTDYAEKSLEIRLKPSDGLEPSTPSLPWKCSTS